MSKIALKPNDSGTGTFTLEAPNSNTNRTLSLPDATGTVATVENLPANYTDSDALDLFNATGSAPVYACRAWVNFDGTTTNIRGSGNVSSITDNGTGDYTVNFTTDMEDADYCVCGSTRWNQDNVSVGLFSMALNGNKTTSQIQIRTTNSVNAGLFDSPEANVTIFR